MRFAQNLAKNPTIFLTLNWGKIGVKSYSTILLTQQFWHTLTPKTTKKHPWLFIQGLFSIAGKGFEPHDLRVMSPTSYQTALPRDILFRQRKCRTPGSNRYDTFVSRDFKSRASANSATPAHTSRTGYSLAACIVYHTTGCLSRVFAKIFLTQ